MRLINGDRLPNIEVKATDGQEYLLLPYKHLRDIPTVEAIPLDRIKKAREEIDDLTRYFDNDHYSSNTDSMFKCNEVLKILDNLIESEG